MPIGFVCDHIEVLYDLDHEAAQVCREIGLTMVRAEAVNDDPLFLDMTADVVLDVWKRYDRGGLSTSRLPLRLSEWKGRPRTADARRTAEASRRASLAGN